MNFLTMQIIYKGLSEVFKNDDEFWYQWIRKWFEAKLKIEFIINLQLKYLSVIKRFDKKIMKTLIEHKKKLKNIKIYILNIENIFFSSFIKAFWAWAGMLSGCGYHSRNRQNIRLLVEKNYLILKIVSEP